jgi:polysaccharide chain length determinant protein (PEP-CTERM system associated)
MVDVTDRLNQARLDLMEAEQARNALQRQIGDTGIPGKPAAVINPEVEARITAVNKQLDVLRLQFTEEHPDIRGARRLLASLEERRREDARKPASGDAGTGYSPMLQAMKVSLSEAEAKVAALRARVDEYATRAARLRAQSSAAPEVEAQLSQLNRDYTVNKDNYQKLVERRESAKLSGDLSSATDMLTFRVIDPPTAPITPVGPKRPQLMSLVFVVALAAGLGVALLMSQFRPTFLSQASLREVTGVPILGSISMNWTGEQQARHKKRLYALAASVFMLFGTYGAVMAVILIRPMV